MKKYTFKTQIWISESINNYLGLEKTVLEGEGFETSNANLFELFVPVVEFKRGYLEAI